jgi:hypothetical protein
MPGDSNQNRREIVKKIGIASSFGVLASTPASAHQSTNNPSQEQIEALERLESRYSTVEDVMNVIREQGDKLLRDLAEHDILDSPYTEQLRPDSLLSFSEYRDGAEGIHVSSLYEDGTATARINVRRKTSDHVVKLYFHPQLSEEYAIVHPHSERNDATIFDGGSTIMGHCDYVGDYCSFSAWWCNCLIEEYEVYACGSDCNKGDLLGCCCEEEDTPCE